MNDLLHHLLIDRLIKMGIAVAALTVLAIGMAIIWRRTGPPSDR
ncbi:hypothetical protein Val02_12290 [Virgisporangium aliadipatigenens]|uniref:Uncharacterized protein n=1 Tax=Virgisporangium aliadipatigenens TaxID=741659 RepID=A0A8J3YHK2_9ACTN|nr:hypothetical protein [Virgisporangium aliadipatigenens]GIJ44343.1 hypothetical protein Val02_12290 [Virgisporangium aliadipatigenens]